MTALHEIIGHGSGKLNPKLTHEPAYYLKEYFSTLEEARADLMALWNVWDPKLQELGLISNPDVAKAMYYSRRALRSRSCARIPKGDTIEEDHQRDRQMIVNYIRDKTGAHRAMQQRTGKLHHVNGFPKDAQGRRHAAGRADAHQGRRRLRRHQGAGGQVRRPLRSAKCAIRWWRAMRSSICRPIGRACIPSYSPPSTPMETSRKSR